MSQEQENSRGLTAPGEDRRHSFAFRGLLTAGYSARFLRLGMVLICIVSSGCRRPSFETVPVSGTVTFQGKPVPYGVVKFQPVAADRGRSALAFIGADGTYKVLTLNDARGLVPGEYHVTVVVEKPPGQGYDRRPPQPTVEASNESPSMVRSGIKLSIDPADGKKVFDIPLDKTDPRQKGTP
jgi:hypothetical protein